MSARRKFMIGAGIKKTIRRYASFPYHFCLLHGGLYKSRVTNVTFEVSSVCNLKCPMCYNHNLRRKKGFMTLENFKSIALKLPKNIKHIVFTGLGEPLLNKDIFSMIRYYRDLNPGACMRVSTNGTNLRAFDSEDILRSGVGQIDIAIDGGTPETHEDYRRGSDFETLCGDVRRLCAKKRELGLNCPKIIQICLLSAKTVPELDMIKKMSESVGFDELHLRYMNIPGLTIRDTDLDNYVYRFFDRAQCVGWIEKYVTTEPYSRYRKKNGEYAIVRERRHCSSFLYPFIYDNGDVSICCNDDDGAHVFGNLLKDDFETIVSRIPAKEIFYRKLFLCKSGNCVLSDQGANYRVFRFNNGGGGVP